MIGMSSACPAFNLVEVNTALIKLLNNPQIDHNEIYCIPDFPTGGYLLNNEEVKMSLKYGTGKACKMRAEINYDEKDSALVVTELPYSVYTNTICGQLEEILNGEENPGIDYFNDLTGEEPLIKIYLKKKANKTKVLNYLYKHTSLESHFGVNLMMLDKGRFPKLFTWKGALQAHLDHEVEIYTRGFLFEVEKIDNRCHIIDGLLKALGNIDEIISIIKKSASTKDAASTLIKKFGFSQTQVKAILDMKLSRLAKLEIEKLEKEKEELLKEKERIEKILNNRELLNREIEKGLLEVIKKYGDERRTKVVTVSENEPTDLPIEKKFLSLSLTNKGGVYTQEVSSINSGKKTNKGTKVQLGKGEFIIKNAVGQSTDRLLLFTEEGKFITKNYNDLVDSEVVYFEVNSPIVNMVFIDDAKSDSRSIMFLTKKGLIKKTKLSEYIVKRKSETVAINLKDGDEVVSVILIGEDDVAILSSYGQYVQFSSNICSNSGRAASGVVGIKLNEGDSAVSMRRVPKDAKELIFVSENGYSLRIAASEFKSGNRAVKGVKSQKGENIKDFYPIRDEQFCFFSTLTTQSKIKVEDIPLLGRGAKGNKIIVLKGENLISAISLI